MPDDQTVVTSGGGSSVAIVALVLILILAVLLFLVFTRGLNINIFGPAAPPGGETAPTSAPGVVPTAVVPTAVVPTQAPAPTTAP